MRVESLVLLWVVAVAPAASAEDDQVPLERIEASAARQIRAVQADASVHAQIPARVVRCRTSTYRTLLADLPQSSRWLAALGLGDYAISDRPDGTFSVDDKAGAKAVCTRALDEDETLVIVAKGTLDVAVLPSIRGTGVILVRYTPEPEDPGVLRCRAVVDFRLDSGFLRMLTRPFKRTLSQVLAEKMQTLIRSATDLAEEIDADPVAVYRRLESGETKPADLKAFRRRFLRL